MSSQGSDNDLDDTLKDIYTLILKNQNTFIENQNTIIENQNTIIENQSLSYKKSEELIDGLIPRILLGIEANHNAINSISD